MDEAIRTFTKPRDGRCRASMSFFPCNADPTPAVQKCIDPRADTETRADDGPRNRWTFSSEYAITFRRWFDVEVYEIVLDAAGGSILHEATPHAHHGRSE